MKNDEFLYYLWNEELKPILRKFFIFLAIIAAGAGVLFVAYMFYLFFLRIDTAVLSTMSVSVIVIASVSVLILYYLFAAWDRWHRKMLANIVASATFSANQEELLTALLGQQQLITRVRKQMISAGIQDVLRVNKLSIVDVHTVLLAWKKRTQPDTI